MPIEMGDLPEWVGGVGTIGAIIFAVITYRQDRERDRVVEKRSQARLIDGWLDGDAGWENNLRCNADGRMLIAITGSVTLSNASQEAARAIEVRVMWRGFVISVANQAALPPTKGEHVPFESVEGEGLPEALTFGSDLGELRTYIEFTDSAGQRWMRTAEGKLQAMRDRPMTQEEIQRMYRRGEIRQSTPYSRWRYYWLYNWTRPRVVWRLFHGSPASSNKRRDRSSQ